MLFAVFLFFLYDQVSGQTVFLDSNEQDKEILRNYDLPVQQTDSLGVVQALSQLISELQSDGYFTASATALQKVDSMRWKVNFKVGERYQWAYLRAGNLDPLMQERSGFREHLFLNRPFSYENIHELRENILKVAENEGYPFANVQLSEVDLAHQEVRAAIHYVPGPYITFGELKVSGTSEVKPDFLATLLKISPGSAYSEKKIERIPSTLRSLPYLEMTAPLEIRFQNDEAEIHIALEERKSNQMDGLVNLLPNENESGSLLLTGKVEILLNNLMKSGKHFSLQWQRLQIESQQLSISYQHPYLFRSPFQAGISFNILKEDTLYINRKLVFSLAYPLSRASLVSITADIRNSSTLSDSDLLSSSGNMAGPHSAEPHPAGLLGNFSLLNVGLSLELNRLNDVLLPTRGWHFYSNAGIGRKHSKSTAVENSEEVSWQPFVQSNFSQYYNLGKLWVLYHRLSGAYLYGKNLYLNDLYRIGGLASLRGFNDNFFFTSYYGLSNVELRLLLEQERYSQSYLYVFYDQSFLGSQLDTQYHISPLGFGLGLSVTTDVGIFNLAYALGKMDNQAIDFSLSKIHFGYTSRF